MKNEMLNAELEINAQAQLGEGPHWDGANECLLWVDIEGGVLHKYVPGARRDDTFQIGDQVSAVVPRSAGGLLLTTRKGICVYDSISGERRDLLDPESHLSDNRFNDGKCDAAGRFWGGTMSVSGQAGTGALYRMDAINRVEQIIPGVTCSNGIAWSIDNSVMYYIDSPTRQVVAYDYNLENGTISGRRVAVDMTAEAGVPDGMTIDAEGKLWIAQWGGWQVSRWDPLAGTKLASVQVPAAQVTSCAFGGEGLDVLYITTARTGLSQEQLERQPLAGGLFRVMPGVNGLAANEFYG